MNRIEKLLTGLLSEQDNVTHYNEMASQDLRERMTLLRMAQTRRNAIRAEIVEEYTELLKACIAAYHHAITGYASLAEQLDADERMEAMLETAIAKARGEES